MKKTCLFSLSLVPVLLCSPLFFLSKIEATENTQTIFTPFTGSLMKDKVRLRIEPHLNSVIVKELKRGELLNILGEEEDFYQVAPPLDIKGYISRKFVLDGVVEANKVNVRLAPSLEGTVLSQLNQGDIIKGTLYPLDNKWMEIEIPSSIHFYVSKDFIENIGPLGLVEEQEVKRKEAVTFIETAQKESSEELQKPFPEIELASSLTLLNRNVADLNNLPEETESAKNLVEHIQKEYQSKKTIYLEKEAYKDKTSPFPLNNAPSDLSMKIASDEKLLNDLETTLDTTLNKQKELRESFEDRDQEKFEKEETAFFNKWVETSNLVSEDQYEKELLKEATLLEGVIQPYESRVKNKPGNFILFDSKTKKPLAYIYSTKYDLHEKAGKEVSLKGVSRPNNHFAFPAFAIFDMN